MTLLALLAALTLSVNQQQLRVVVIEGEGAVNIIQQKTAVAPVIEVRDQNNLPVAGAVVRFTIAGGKQATFAGGTQTITVTTNAAGRATATGTDLNYEVIENSRTDCRIGSNESFRSNSTGTWSLSSNTITFNARADNFLFDAATISGTTLSMTARPPHIEAGKDAPRVNTTWRK